MQYNVILASQSPRRKDLLTQMGVSFQAIPSNFDEYLDDARDVAEIAKELALGKAMAIAKQHPDAIVIGSDCIVSVDGNQLGKPEDFDEARATLRRLSGRANTITTSIVVVHKASNTVLADAANAEVIFKPLNEAAIEAYVQTGDPLDKAGSYGIQSGAAPLIKEIRGDYDVIIGLPTALLADMLAQFGIAAQSVKVSLPDIEALSGERQ